MHVFNTCKTLIVLIGFCAFLSCDYYYGYDLYLENSTSEDLKIEVYRFNRNGTLELRDELIITPGLGAKIVDLGGGNCAKDCPVNELNLELFSEHYNLDSIAVKLNDQLLDFNYINTISNWSFYSENQLGVYEIEIFDSNFQ